MYKALDAYLLEIWRYSDAQMNKELETTNPIERNEALPLLLKGYLDTYHSDYRWMVKYFRTPRGEH